MAMNLRAVLITMVYLAGVSGGLLLGGCEKKAAVSAGVKHDHDHDHDHDHGHDHDHDHADVPKVATVAQLLTELRAREQSIRTQLATGKAGDVHTEAHIMTELAAAAGKTALADASIARDKVRDVNVAGKAVATAADELHVLADQGKVAEASAKLDALVTLITKLESAAGTDVGPWVCDMHCEPGKTYAAAGKCPVCKMALTPMSEMPYSLISSVESKAIEVGKPVQLKLQLLDRVGLPVGKLEVVHEQILHLLTVSNDLSWYSHEHPQRQADGSFAIALTFPRAGEYTMFADFTPVGQGQQVPTAALLVPGTAAKPMELIENIDTVQTIDGYVFRIRCNGGSFVAGRDEVMRYGIGLPPDGTEVIKDLEPYLGALGHLVIISQDLKTFVHAHPLNGEVGAGHDHADGQAHHHGGASPDELMAKAAKYGNGSPSDPVFHVVFPRPGFYRAFAQFQHKGKILTVVNTINVLPGEEGATPTGKPSDHDSHKHHDHGKAGGGA